MSRIDIIIPCYGYAHFLPDGSVANVALLVVEGEDWGFERQAGQWRRIRKGQVHNIDGRDMQAQASFIAGIFQIAA